MRTVRPALHGLIDAMNDAEQDHRPIPCKNGDPRWTADLLTVDIVVQLTEQCRSHCPVLAECDTMRLEAKALNLPITGIVAGVHLELGKVRPRVGRTCVDCKRPVITQFAGRLATPEQRREWKKNGTRILVGRGRCGGCHTRQRQREARAALGEAS